MKVSAVALAGTLLLACAGSARAVTVADLEFKDPLWGEGIDADSLKDRVVVVYFWAAD